VDTIPAWLIALMLLVGIFLFYSIGRQLGEYQRRHNPEAKSDGIGPLEGALLGLLALLLSFTFGMSASRYDVRRSLAVKEANALGTAILRADVYPDSIRRVFRKDLQQYLEVRIAYYEARHNPVKIKKTLEEGAVISTRIWNTATAYARQSATTMPHSMMIPALNEVIDIVTSREAARMSSVPALIIFLLMILCLMGSCIIGYSRKEKKNDWIVLTIYSIMTVITIFTILDLDRPRRGLIKTSVENHMILELRSLFTSE
jgi:uncharacterized protein YneF (UPF0154 family)